MIAATGNPLVAKIEAAARAKGINTGTELCRRMKVSASTWSNIQSNRRNMGRKFLARVAAVFPELRLEVMEYMAYMDSSLDQSA